MGDEVTTQVTEGKTTPTDEEEELNKLMLERAKAAQPQLLEIQKNAGNLSNQLLLGENLPGYLSGLPGGIDESTISNMVGQSLEDVASQGNAFGILDSGVVQEQGIKRASEIRAGAKQFNLQNLNQLLNLAVGGQAQVQAPMLQQEQFLGTQLAGLRSTSSSTTLTQMNPFLKSLQSSMGEGIGTGASAAMFACWVAKEIFGSWEDDRTILARYYIHNLGPKWFSKFYMKFGERIANFISDKPVCKAILKPLFDWFVVKAKIQLVKGGV